MTNERLDQILGELNGGLRGYFEEQDDIDPSEIDGLVTVLLKVAKAKLIDPEERFLPLSGTICSLEDIFDSTLKSMSDSQNKKFASEESYGSLEEALKTIGDRKVELHLDREHEGGLVWVLPRRD